MRGGDEPGCDRGHETNPRVRVGCDRAVTRWQRAGEGEGVQRDVIDTLILSPLSIQHIHIFLFLYISEYNGVIHKVLSVWECGRKGGTGGAGTCRKGGNGDEGTEVRRGHGRIG